MSKKNKKKNQIKNFTEKMKDEPIVIKEEDLGLDKSDIDGPDPFIPIVLTPTVKGRKMLDDIQKRKNQKLMDIEKIIDVDPKEVQEKEPVKEETPEPEKFNFEQFEKSLDKATTIITDDGKYGRAKDAVSQNQIKEFIQIYSTSTDESILPSCDTIARKLINLGKSFYEYDDKSRELLSNESYDGLVARYLERGNVEPSGIIPKGKKNMTKVQVKYPTLHNNMDKAYAVYIADPIPDGVKEKDSIEKFLQRVYKALGITSETEISIELSPKIDGVSVNGTVVKDMLRNPQTRGGDLESISIMGMDGLQVTTFHNDREFGIQYEAFVTEEDRVAASEYLKIDPPYVSCRHAASGLISRLATKEDDKLFQFISLYPIMAEGLEGTYEEVLDYLQNFAVVPKDMPERKIVKGDLKTLLKKISKQFHKLSELRADLSFAIDGMVITVTDDDYQTIIGREGRTNKYQIALKFDPSTAIGVVEGIHMDTGRKGYRTLQVDLKEPVFLDGVRYDHVPVLSAELFNDLELREGCEVTVHRVGDVIPAIKLKTAGDGKRLTLPDKCPVCHQPLIIKARKLFCANPLCKGNIIGRMLEFFDKLGMDDYGESFAEMLHTEFGVNSLGGLFVLINKDTIKDSGINSKKLEEFPDALREAIGDTVDYKVIGAMGIPGVGPAKAQTLLKWYGLDGLVKLGRTPDSKHEPLLQNCLRLVGSTTYEATCRFLESNVYRDDIHEIAPYIKKITKNFDDMVAVGHTGFTPGKKVKEACDSKGWDLTDGRNFKILLVPTKEHKSTKVTIAEKKGLPIMTSEEFLNYVEALH